MSPVKARTISRSADIASLLESLYCLRRHEGTECFGFFEICSAEAVDNSPISLIIRHRTDFIEVLSTILKLALASRVSTSQPTDCPSLGSDGQECHQISRCLP